jgi:hypothetical protein
LQKAAAVFPPTKYEPIALPMVAASWQRDRAARLHLGLELIDWEARW